MDQKLLDLMERLEKVDNRYVFIVSVSEYSKEENDVYSLCEMDNGEIGISMVHSNYFETFLIELEKFIIQKEKGEWLVL